MTRLLDEDKVSMIDQFCEFDVREYLNFYDFYKYCLSHLSARKDKLG